MEQEVSEIFNRYAIDAARRFSASAKVDTISEITSDLSLRRFVRLVFAPGSAPVPSAVLMYYLSTQSAEAGGQNDTPSNTAFVELAPVFQKLSVAVPLIYVDMPQEKLTLVEDLGDETLGSALVKDKSSIQKHLRESIDQLLKIQSADVTGDCFAYRRFFSEELFLKETLQYRDYALKGVDGVKQKLVTDFLAWLSTVTSKRNRCLVHRDFHPWNILVHNERIRVIDFQDALIGPLTYDLISLLNDRDSDSLIGESNWSEAVEYYLTCSGLGDFGREDILFCSLVRDFKVAGLFIKSKQLRNLDKYVGWVPGTERRLGRNLRKMFDLKLIPQQFLGVGEAIATEREDFRSGYVG